jgi:hypothetical protein
MLPVQPGDQLDVQESGGVHPNGDETANNDGWGAFSGTSAAAPQLAGAAALVKQACRRLTPAEVKDVLMRTARDVTVGHNHPRFNNQATVGSDTATGNGLVDAHKAVLVAKLRCIAIPVLPIHPFIPLPPLQPVHPVLPLQPLHPVLPLQPLHPVLPLQPLHPVLPLQPLIPLLPIAPIGPGPDRGGSGGAHLSADDLRQLEDMIIKSRRGDVL